MVPIIKMIADVMIIMRVGFEIIFLTYVEYTGKTTTVHPTRANGQYEYQKPNGRTD